MWAREVCRKTLELEYSRHVRACCLVQVAMSGRERVWYAPFGKRKVVSTCAAKAGCLLSLHRSIAPAQL